MKSFTEQPAAGRAVRKLPTSPKEFIPARKKKKPSKNVFFFNSPNTKLKKISRPPIGSLNELLQFSLQAEWSSWERRHLQCFFLSVWLGLFGFFVNLFMKATVMPVGFGTSGCDSPGSVRADAASSPSLAEHPLPAGLRKPNAWGFQPDYPTEMPTCLPAASP